MKYRFRASQFSATLLIAGACALFLAARPSSSPSNSPEQRIVLGKAETGSLYAITVAIKDPAAFTNQRPIEVRLSDAQGVVAKKYLHGQDLDFYLTMRPREDGVATVELKAAAGETLPAIVTSFDRSSTASTKSAVIAAAPNNTPDLAQTVEFGQTIYGGADDRPYAPAPGQDRYAALIAGFQWFRFTFHGAQPRLAYFVLDVTDREVPFDVDVFTRGKTGGIEPYTTGASIYQIEATQNYPGLYKFRTRILQPGGTYYLRVHANHPSFQLRTFDYPVPPYTDPHQAVRAGMDFLVNMGDSWLSNTPRRGAVALRTTMNHGDTQQCIACHPTQFTTRGYLTAVSHGYAPTQRPGLEFLADRIYNNQRPLYGEPGADWVRVIYSARTVASRLPLIEHLYETNVTHDAPRVNSFEIPYGKFLQIHYKDRTAMPGDETDGCEPEVSAFEIAAQSWETFNMLYEQTHDPQWQASRDMVERLAVPYKPENMIDLNWKIQFLATAGREKYAAQLQLLIDELYSHEQPEGMWGYAFDKDAKPADFISYNAVLALALAGRRPETDPKLALALQTMLKAQRPEGSWEGDPVYQGFNTPFRATQFAVMALSTLYPGPDTKPSAEKLWGDAFEAPPIKLATDNLPELLSQLDQFWDPAPASTLKQIRELLARNRQPLAREAAARALGHMADSGSIKVLVASLGDPSKMVQRSSAWALRMILERRPEATTEGRAQLTSALASPDARERWGATELFNQHFKYVAGDAALRTALERDLNDPAPGVRLNASKGLWQWSYWSADDRDARTGILETLATRLNTETDPTVRRAIHESIYDVLDENTGYLEAWVRAAATDEDQARIRQGYEFVARDQAAVLAKVLRSGTQLGREGILESLWDFHIRHYSLPELKEGQVSVALPAVFTKYVSGVPELHVPGYEYPPYRDTADFHYDVHNGFFQTRVGNDSDLIHFFESSGPALEDALIACLRGSDSAMKIEVLKAGSTLSGAGDARFAKAALDLALDPDKDVRETVGYVYQNGQRGILNINTPAQPDPGLVRTISEILDHGDRNAQDTVLPLLASLPSDSPWITQPQVVASLRALLERTPRPANYAEALTAAASFPELMQEPRIRTQVLDGAKDPDRDVQRASIQIALERLSNPQEAGSAAQILSQLGTSQRSVFIELVSDPKFLVNHLGVSGGALSQDQNYFLGKRVGNRPVDLLDQRVVFEAVMASLQDSDANVRAAALDLLRKSRGIDKRPEFRAAMERMREDPNPRLQLIAKNVMDGKRLSEALADVKPGSVLDFNYFVAKVEPILATPGADGKACVMCHASHVIFKLHPPNAEGQFSPQDSEENYKYAMRVVDIADPAHSLMLVKPTRPTDSAGNVADYLATHNGGQRWPGNESSWQYKTILSWVRGAKAGGGTE
ncbi:MAG TPA: HEAT repeat domain-containing protein [Bryobacteraceae bacterium]|jgi:HEAT repeat protein|nr:HEAT repeat domain-containing protein [Bryobacteraceae bacterium]